MENIKYLLLFCSIGMSTGYKNYNTVENLNSKNTAKNNQLCDGKFEKINIKKYFF